MSGVSNGQLANENTFNDAFMARNGNTDTSGKVGLLNTAPESGAQIANAQGFVNHIADTVGTTEGDANAKNYSSNNYVADGDSRKTAIEKLDTQLKTTQTDLDTAEAAIVTHESRLDGHDTDIGNLTTGLNNHTANTSNPHSVTKAQVGLDNVTDDAQLKRAAGDFATFTEKSIVANDDLVLIEDSAAAGAKKKVKMLNMGGGSGTGSKNYFPTSVAQGDSVVGFSQYKSGTTSPITLTGGAPSGNFEIITSSVAPLAGLNSHILRKKNAANCQGEGVSYTMNLDPADYGAGKILSFLMDYGISSGTYADGDVACFVEAVTGTGGLKPLSANNIKNHLMLSQRCQRMEVQIPTDCTQLRFAFHCTTASTADFEIKMDSLLFGPQDAITGPIKTSFVSFSGNITGSASGTLNVGTGGGATQFQEWSQDGEEILIRYRVRIGTSGTSDVTGAYIFPLPPGVSLNHNNYDAIGTGDITIVASAVPVARLNAKYYGGGVILDVSDSLLLSNGGLLYNNANTVSVTVRAKVVGWSSSTIMSSDADTRITAAHYTSATETLPYNTTKTLSYGTKLFDTHGMYDGTTFTAPSPGYYRFTAYYQIGTATPAASGVSLQVSVRNITQAVTKMVDHRFIFTTAGLTNFVAGGSTTLEFKAGETGDVRGYQDIQNTTLATSSANRTFLIIEKLSGPSQIAASSTSAISYTTSAGQSIANASTVIVDFGTKEFDYGLGTVTTGASWKWVPNAPGLYLIEALIRYANSQSWTSGQYIGAHVYKNGAVAASEDFLIPASFTPAQGPGVSICKPVRLLPTDYVDIRTAHGESSARTLVAAGTLVRLSITLVGRY